MAYERYQWQNGISPLNEKRINNIEDGIEEALHKVETLRARVLELANSGLDIDTSELEATIATLSSSLSTLQTNVGGLGDDVSLLTTKLGQAESTITGLSNDLITANNTITGLQTNLNTANSNISTLQSSLNTANSNISTLQTSLNTANSNIGTLQSNLATAQSDLSSAQATISSLETSLSNANITISSLQTDLTTAQNTINTLTDENNDLKWKYNHHTHCIKEKWTAMKTVSDWFMSIFDANDDPNRTRLDTIFDAAEASDENYMPKLEYQLLSKYENDEDYDEYRTMIRVSAICNQLYYLYHGLYFLGYTVGLIGYMDEAENQFTTWFYSSGSGIKSTYANISTTLATIYNDMPTDLKNSIEDVISEGQPTKLFVYDKASVEKIYKYQEKDADNNRIIYANDIYWLSDEGSTTGKHKTYNPETNTFGEDDDTAEHPILFGFAMGKTQPVEESEVSEEPAEPSEESNGTER